MTPYDTPLFDLLAEETRGQMRLDEAHARRTDPVESHQAARSVKNITAVQRAILNGLRTPRTDEALYLYLKWVGVNVSPSGARSRRAELVTRGLVVRVGTSKTAAGRSCAVWSVNGAQTKESQ